MKIAGLILSAFVLFFCFTEASAQSNTSTENATIYKAEVFGSAGSGDFTPFWMTTNRYGKVPLEAGNGFLNAGIFHNQRFGRGFYWNAGVDMIISAPRYRNVYIQQLYAEIGYQALRLSIGSKENYTSLWDRRLSSGDMVFSSNARPIPEINISIPEFTAIPFTREWVYIKGDFAVGKSFDTKYLDQFVNESQVYITDVLWHHKSMHLQFGSSKKEFPLSVTLGVQHWAQWGGTSTNPDIGKQPKSLKDLIRIIAFKEGGGDATVSDQINVLGNHYGSYDFRLSYYHGLGSIHAYHQRYFEDKSGVEFANGTDGLWGLEVEIKQFSWLKKLVMETVNTRNQSGPFHYIDFDRENYSGRGGGADNYYNNGEYVTGVSYFNRSLGNALLTSPEYNKDGRLGFRNNRIRDWHLGAEGIISPRLDYRFLFTAMNGWGTHYEPFLEKKTGTSCMVELKYNHPTLKGWLFGGAVGLDTGNITDNGFGFSFSVSKRGILHKW